MEGTQDQRNEITHLRSLEESLKTAGKGSKQAIIKGIENLIAKSLYEF